VMRSHVDCDWDKEFMSTNLDVEDMWNILKTRIDDGIKRFVSLTSRFQSNKWKRPLKEDIRDQIRLKKNLWRTYVRDRDNSSWLKYTKQRNKVKQLIKKQESLANANVKRTTAVHV